MFKRKLKAILCIFAVCLCMLAGCEKKEKDDATGTDALEASAVIMKVGEDEITKEESLVYCLLSLLSGQYKYMNVLADESMIENMIIDEIRTNKILYRQALSQGFSLNEEDEEVVDDLIERFTGYVTKDILKQYDISDEIIKKVFTENSLVDKFENDKQNEIGKGYNEEALEEYKDYNFQKLMYLVVPAVKADENGEPLQDENGNYIPLNEDEKKAAKEKADSVVEEINSGAKLEEVTEKYAISDYCYEQTGYVGAYKDELNEKLGAMKEGQCTEVMENDTCYYSIALISNNDKAVMETYAYATAKARLEEEYAKLKEEWLAKVPFEPSDIIDDYWTKFDLAEVATTLFKKQIME